MFGLNLTNSGFGSVKGHGVLIVTVDEVIDGLAQLPLAYARGSDCARHYSHPSRALVLRDGKHARHDFRKSISASLTSWGFSCWVQWPQSLITMVLVRFGTDFFIPEAIHGGSTGSFSAQIISAG
jgi:hypothetical protein